MMKIIRKLSMAVLIAGSMGAISGYSTVAVAAENASGVSAAFGATMKHIDDGIASASAGDQDATLAHLKIARQAIKDITGDSWAMHVQRAGTALRIANTRTKRGDLTGAEEKLKSAQDSMRKAMGKYQDEMG